MPYFDQAHYIAQKVAQMNATHYVGRTGSADTVWTQESAEAELAVWGITWEDNFNACNTSGYASSVTAADINVSGNPLFNVNEYAQALANYNNANSVNGQTNWTAASAVDYVLNTQHQSLLSHYTHIGASLGLNPSNAFDTMAWAEQQGAANNQSAAQVLAALQTSGQNPLEAFFADGGTVETAPAVAADAAVTAPADFNPWATGTGGDTPGGDTSGGDETGSGIPTDVQFTQTITLSPNQDDYTGAADQNTLFIGHEFDGVNTLQSGDIIKGGGGINKLEADVTAGNTFGQTLNAVRPEVSGVQIIKFTSQQSTDTADGDLAQAEIRADRISDMVTGPGVLKGQLWNSDSRYTLTTNDVRIDSNTMQIGWQNADNAMAAGHDLDNVVRYNNQYLKAGDFEQSSELVLRLIDGEFAPEGNPLQTNTYYGIQFTYDGSPLELNFGVVDGTSTYDDLVAAINNEIDNGTSAGAQAARAAGIRAYRGEQFTVFNRDGEQVTGYEVILEAPHGVITVDRNQGDGWLMEGTQDPNSNLSATMEPATTESCPLITTDINLDNVGMVNWFDIDTCIPDDQQFGDYAGDMIVGGMGDGKYVGVQRFDTYVDRGSWLSSLQSTNDALRFITVTNIDMDDEGTNIGTSTTPIDGAGTDPIKKGADFGNLFVGDGVRLSDNGVAGNSLMFEGRYLKDMKTGEVVDYESRDGVLADARRLTAEEIKNGKDIDGNVVHVGQTIASGIVDVARFDASAMGGKANIAAAITEMSSHKYLGDTDQVDALGQKFVPQPAFEYKFGSNNDTLNMVVNGNVAADNDFTLTINMGAGDNSVHTQFTNTWQGLGNQDAGKNWDMNWVQDQWQNNNARITAQDGDDIVNPWGTGRVNVYTNGGDDVVYSDNSGVGELPAKMPTPNASWKYLNQDQIDGLLTGDYPVGTQHLDAAAMEEYRAYQTEAINAVRDFVTDPVAGVGAIWGYNLDIDNSHLVVRNGEFEIVPYGNNNLSNTGNINYVWNNVDRGNGPQVRIDCEVSYKGVAAIYSIYLPVNSNGTVEVDTAKLNELICDTVNQGTYAVNAAPFEDEPSWLHALLDVREGAGHSLLFISKVDGIQEGASGDSGVSFGFRVYQGSGTRFERVAGDLDNFVNRGHTASEIYPSTNEAVHLGDEDLMTAVMLDGDGNVVKTVEEATIDNMLPINSDNQLDDANLILVSDTQQGEVVASKVSGNNGASHADNLVNLGQGVDLAVFGTGLYSNETIQLNNEYNGHNVVVNLSMANDQINTDFMDISAILGGRQAQVVAGYGEVFGDPNGANVSTYLVWDDALTTFRANSLVMHMDHVPGTNTATFHMSRAEIGSQGEVVSTTDLGYITFSNFITEFGDETTAHTYMNSYGAWQTQVKEQLAPNAHAEQHVLGHCYINEYFNGLTPEEDNPFNQPVEFPSAE